MAFQIDPSIPLQAQRTTFDPAAILMQAQQGAANLEKHRFEMQKLREDYDLAKEKRAQEKKMQQGMASELQKIQQGTPAQYRTTFPQTIPTGQMPQGMTGVLAAERGQNMPTGQMPSGMTGVLANERGKILPQPAALFGENILQGDFDINRELVSPAVAGRTPDLKDYLEIRMKQAFAHGDEKGLFETAKLLKDFEKNPTKYFGGLTEAVDPVTKQPILLAMTETGAVPSGYSPNIKEPLTAKEKFDQDLAERKFRAEQSEKQRQYDLDYKKYIADLNKPAPIDPIEKAGAIADVKAEAKVRQDLIGDAANVVKTYNLMNPMISSAIDIVKKLPPDMLQSKYQSMLAGTPLNKYLGNPEQQKAITDYNLMLENLRLHIEKPAGAISNYEQGILGRAIGILEGNYSNEQKESALKQVKGIFDNQKNVAENVLKQNKAERFNYNSQKDKPLRFTKQANSAQRKEYGDAIFAAKGDPEKIREIQEYARELGVLE